MKRERRSQNGEVTLFQPEGAKTWWCRYTVQGKQSRQNTGCADKDDARNFAANVARMVGLANSKDLDQQRRLLTILQDLIGKLPELRAEAAGKLSTGDLPTVRVWFNRELTEMANPPAFTRKKAVKPSSVNRQRQIFDDWFTYLDKLPVPMADATLDRITPVVVRGFLEQLKTEGLAGKSLKFAHARLRAVFGHAVNLRLIHTNPAVAKELNPKTGRMEFDDKTNRRSFNLKQVAAILEVAGNSDVKWLKLSALLALFTGQRSGDLGRMQWPHVKELDGTLPRIVLEQTKTGVALVIPIAEELRRTLQAVPSDQRTGYLLPANICEAYQTGLKRMFQRPWRDLLDKLDLAGMEELPIKARIEASGKRGRVRNAWVFHSWRHTTATHLSGADAHYLLGHRNDDERDLGTTELYRHEDLLRIKKALDGIPTSAADNVVELKAVNQ